MPGICRFLLENYRDEIETAMRLTREKDVEHGFNVIGEVGEMPDVRIIEGEEGSIDTGMIPPEPDIGISFHAHHVPEDIIEGRGLTADAIIQGGVSGSFSPHDLGAFTTIHLQQEGTPDDRDPGFIRGSAMGSWGGQTPEIEGYLKRYTLQGMELTENVVGLSMEQRMDVAIATGIAYDGEVPDAPRVPIPEWVPPEDELAETPKERFAIVDEWVRTCEMGPLDLRGSLQEMREEIRDRMEDG